MVAGAAEPKATDEEAKAVKLSATRDVWKKKEGRQKLGLGTAGLKTSLEKGQFRVPVGFLQGPVKNLDAAANSGDAET